MPLGLRHPKRHPTDHALLPTRRFFGRLDRDRSGALDAVELQRGLAMLGLGLVLAEAEAVCRHWDRNGSGTLDLEEFLRALRVRCHWGCLGTLVSEAEPVPELSGTC